MPEPLDIATLREVAEAATPGPWTDFHDTTRADEALVVQGEDGDDLALCPDCGTRAEYVDVVARHIATFDPPTVLALLSELADLRALWAAVEALAEEHERTVTPAPYTSERALIERLRALLATHVPSPLPVGGAAGSEEART